MSRVKPDTVPPVAGFSGNPTTGYAPLTVQFTDQSLHSPTSWLWNFGDGTPTSNVKNPSHVYANIGTYSVSLTVTNAYGSDAITKTNYITTSQPPVSNIHVAGMTVTRISQPGRRWAGSASVTIVDEWGTAVSGATVSGYFNAPNSNTKSGVTGANGKVTINSDKSKTAPLDWCFQVTNVVKTGETYDPVANVVTRACESGPVFKITADILPGDFSVTTYPNPFNPTTTIQMNLPVASDWSISIYNITGQKVEEFTGTSPSGLVSVTWNASRYSSGVYIYKANAGQYVKTDKMLLLK